MRPSSNATRRACVVGDLQDYQGDLRALLGSFGRKLKEFAFGQNNPDSTTLVAKTNASAEGL